MSKQLPVRFILDVDSITCTHSTVCGKKPLRRCLFYSGSRYSLLMKKEDARDYFNFISICHRMKFDPLIIAIDGVRFRPCRCQKILEKYNKRPFNILKESSYLDGQIFLVRPT